MGKYSPGRLGIAPSALLRAGSAGDRDDMKSAPTEGIGARAKGVEGLRGLHCGAGVRGKECADAASRPVREIARGK